jgi:hypothetical protein
MLILNGFDRSYFKLKDFAIIILNTEESRDEVSNGVKGSYN